MQNLKHTARFYVDKNQELLYIPLTKRFQSSNKHVFIKTIVNCFFQKQCVLLRISILRNCTPMKFRCSGTGQCILVCIAFSVHAQGSLFYSPDKICGITNISKLTNIFFSILTRTFIFLQEQFFTFPLQNYTHVKKIKHK